MIFSINREEPKTKPIVDSIASTRATIGRDATLHLDVLWRDLMKFPGSVEDDHFFRLVTGEQHPLGNVVIFSESCDVSVVENAVDPLLDVTAPAAVLFVAGRTETVTQKLNALGFSLIAPLPAMAVDIASLAQTKLPSGYEFIRVSSRQEGTQWADVVATGFGIPRGLARMMSPEVHGVSPAPDAKAQFFAVRHGENLVATAMLYLANGLAGIYSVTTVSEERGKGLGAHVTAEALRAAHKMGYGVGVLQSSEAGHSVYWNMGFRDFDSVAMFIRMIS